MGKKGQTISEIQKNETFIQVLDVEQNPKCIAENNHQVVQVVKVFFFLTQRLKKLVYSVNEAYFDISMLINRYLVLRVIDI